MLVTRNNLWDDFFGFYGDRVNPLPTDIIEEENAYRLEIEVPGYCKEDLSISLEKGNLIVEVKAKMDENIKYIRKERKQDQLSRAFYVGKHLSTKDIQASFDQGILTILIPKYDLEKKESKYSIPIIG